MIELFFAPTPNGWKITVLLEELGIPYRVTPVDLANGGQYAPEFLAISPNNRIPAIVDHAPAAGEPIALFESGAIMLYLAEKHGRFLPADLAGRYAVTQWLMWQMAALGPMLGQNGHFLLYADEDVPYARQRYGNEGRRLYGVLDRQLGKTRRMIAGDDYSIADMACFPWIMTHKAQQFDLAEFPYVQRWYAELRARPALQRGLAVGRDRAGAVRDMTPGMRRQLFGISAEGHAAGRGDGSGGS